MKETGKFAELQKKWFGEAFPDLPVSFEPGILELPTRLLVSRGDIVAMLQGAVVTVTLSFVGILIGLPLGLGLAILRWANTPLLARVVAVYVSMLRATPLVTLLLLLFSPCRMSACRSARSRPAVLALVMNTSAFKLRGLARLAQRLSQGPVRGRAGGRMRAGQRFRRNRAAADRAASLPGLVNEMSLLIKVTPVLAVVGVVDITRAAVRIGAETFEPLPPFLLAVALYVPIVFALVSLQRFIERRQAEAAA
jgi:His/Glu/Gln/Arg/opine family amino acid ABC transporter permease subunit